MKRSKVLRMKGFFALIISILPLLVFCQPKVDEIRSNERELQNTVVVVENGIKVVQTGKDNRAYVNQSGEITSDIYDRSTRISQQRGNRVIHHFNANEVDNYTEIFQSGSGNSVIISQSEMNKNAVMNRRIESKKRKPNL